ncbi:MAG: carboxypeptidase-like regulatory domain-containing protein [Clostridium sp.]|nr:carboxypeptidase-like regulatory domain-containing protein [Bacteroides sp.]MCM1197269.1 carboxypeptidase-like regulatory domain-containing protein [Clostridium sp.]
MKRTDMILLFATALLMLMPVRTNGQRRPSSVTRILSGIVSDDQGGLPGATVYILNTDKRIVCGEVTGLQGEYLIELPENTEGLTVVIGFIGYETVRVPYDGQKELNVHLKDNYETLSSAVVSENADRKNIAGVNRANDGTAREFIDVTAYEDMSVTSIEDMLQGKLANVDILSSSGDPGTVSTIRIRGDTESPSANVIASKTGSSVEFTLEEIKLWSVDNPYLYGLRIAILRNGKEIDSVNGYTAVRKISAKRDRDGFKRMALNDKCLFQFGPLDQGWWPDGLYTAPTDEALRYDILKTKEWGFNMIRKHVKVEPARWYYYCDQAGILVWQDMPNIGARRNNEVAKRDPEMAEAQRNRWVGDSFAGGNDCNIPEEWKENYYREWGEIIDFLKGFQCIVVWVPFNEAWGQFETRKAVEFTKEKDPSRLVNPASGGNYAICGDILDMHHYPHPKMNVYENTMVNVIGEYGGLGLPVEGHLWQKDQNWGYGGVKASSGKVISLYEQFAGRLKTYVSVGCSAAVYTQTTDVEGEVNGIMTYDRKVIKFDEKRLCDANVSVIESMSR